MILTEILSRIDRRLEAMGLSDNKASDLAGKRDSIRNMRRAAEAGKDQKPKIETLNALAPVLGTSATWLLAGAGPETPDAPAPAEAFLLTDEVTLSRPRPFVRPLYGGIVEAGSFREANAFDDDPERIMPAEEVDDRFPKVPLISFTVAGDSMNALQPTPILPGQRVVGLDFEGLRNRVHFRDGMVVVVEQILGGGHLHERSVKQIELHRDRTEFCPRSSNPKHKPIVVPFDMVEQGAGDGREVKVIAIVIRVVSDMPRW